MGPTKKYFALQTLEGTCAPSSSMDHYVLSFTGQKNTKVCGMFQTQILFCQESWVTAFMKEMPHGAQKQEQLFPWACTVEINNAIVILGILLHLSTLLHYLNSHQFCSFYNDLACSLCWRMQSHRNVFSPPDVVSFFCSIYLFIYLFQSVYLFPAQFFY